MARQEIPAPAPRRSTRSIARELLRAALAGESPSLGPWLEVLDGPQAGRRVGLSAAQLLGRGPDAPFRVDDPHLSRRHARFSCSGGAMVVEDLGSKNGTLRNGRRLEKGPNALAPGDEIAAGATRLRLVPPDGEERADTPGGSPGPLRAARLPGFLALAAALLLGACALSLAFAALA